MFPFGFDSPERLSAIGRAGRPPVAVAGGSLSGPRQEERREQQKRC